MTKIISPLFPTVSPQSIGGVLETYPITTRQSLNGFRDQAYAINKILNSWTVYAPVVSSSLGAITTLGSVVAKYKVLGTTVIIQFNIPIVTNGTGTGDVRLTAPFTLAGAAVGGGREIAVGGKALAVTWAGGIILINNYDNTYPGGNGHVLVGGVLAEVI